MALKRQAVSQHAREPRRDQREPLGEQQHAHADQQHATATLDEQQVRPDGAHDAQRAVDGQPGQQEWDAQTQRVQQEQHQALADRLLTGRQRQQPAQERANARRPTGAKRDAEQERAEVTALGVRLQVGDP